MSTQTRHGPYGLPEVYQVYIPEDRTDCSIEEFNKIIRGAAPNSYPGGGQSGGWHKIGDGYYYTRHSKYLGIPEVSYSDWKKAILGEPDPVYNVGDEVVRLNIPDKSCSQLSNIPAGTKGVIKTLYGSEGLHQVHWETDDIFYCDPKKMKKVEKVPTSKYITPVVGKWYTCLSGYINTSSESSGKVYGGSGYETGRVFKCGDISYSDIAHKGESIL